MQTFLRMDARMKLYESMSMADSRDTYRAFGGRRARDLDWFCFREVLGSDWDAYLVLKMPLVWISVSHFFKLFLKFVLVVFAAFWFYFCASCIV